MNKLSNLPENIAGLLMEKHDLTVEDISTGSDWQSGFPWMRLGTEYMTLSPYQSLTITREVGKLIEEEWFKDVTLLSEPLTLEKGIPGLHKYWSKYKCFYGYHIFPHPSPSRAEWKLIS